MSLISDALKEAQRERSERAGAPAQPNASSPDAFFPSPNRQQSRRLSPLIPIGAGAAVLLIVVVILLLKVRAKPEQAVRANAAPTTTSPATSAPIAPAHSALTPTAASPRPESPKAQSLSIAPERAQIAKAPSVEAPTREVPDQPVRPIRRAESTGSAASILPTANDTLARPAPVATRPQPTLAASSGMRLVLDPAGTRPSDSLFSQAYTEQLRGNYDRAADLYEKALQIKPVSPQLYNDYGALLAARGNHTAAIALYNLGLKADENEPRLWINLGDSYKATGRHADAMSTYAEAAKLDPTNAGLKIRLAAEYAAIGDTASARRGYDDASRTAPSDPSIHHAVGVYLQSQHDYRGAIREFQLFVDLAPGKYPAETIDAVRAHIVRLAKLAS